METASRDEKLENLIVNYTLIFMGMFEEAFAAIAEKMSDMMAVGASSIAGALGAASTGQTEQPQGADVAGKVKEASPRVAAEIQKVFSGMRKEMAGQWPKNTDAFKRYVAGPDFDKGIEIVQRYDFGLPRLTEGLSDEVLASYVVLVKNNDENLSAMLKELADWQASLPRPPWAKEEA